MPFNPVATATPSERERRSNRELPLGYTVYSVVIYIRSQTVLFKLRNLVSSKVSFASQVEHQIPLKGSVQLVIM